MVSPPSTALAFLFFLGVVCAGFVPPAHPRGASLVRFSEPADSPPPRRKTRWAPEPSAALSKRKPFRNRTGKASTGGKGAGNTVGKARRFFRERRENSWMNALQGRGGEPKDEPAGGPKGSPSSE